MLKQRTQSVALLVLMVVLLLVVSSRVSPDTARGERDAVSVDDMWSGGDYPRVTETPASTEAPEVALRELFPDVYLGDWNLKLINNDYATTAGFIPGVTDVRDGQKFDARAADALEELCQAAEEAGYTVCLRDGYRSYRDQATIFNGWASTIKDRDGITLEEAEQIARTITFYPGTSDHQTGLGMDIMDSAATDRVAEEVENLPLLVWLKEHAAEYGFILRYPKDKREITGGWYEPWHFRYVGKEIAEYMYEHNLCLEEFYRKF